MKLLDRFLEIFGELEHEAEAAASDVGHSVESIVHQAEKEITMSIPRSISDALARIKAAFSAGNDQSAADQKTISDQAGQIQTLQGQVADLTAAGSAKDQQITDLTQQRDDAVSQLNDIESAILAISPDPTAQAAA